MSAVSVWVLVGAQPQAAYRNRQRAEEEGDEYTGPMDDRSYAIFNTFYDNKVTQDLYKVKGTFFIFGLNFPDEATAVADIDYLDAVWPNPQVQPYGAWYWDTGLQVGMHYIYDEDGNVIGIEGDPVYPIPSDCYQIMPDVVVYDEDGNEISRTPATSNADLRDINLVLGQTPRVFEIAATRVTILKSAGAKNDPAIIRVNTPVVSGERIESINRYTESGSSDVSLSIRVFTADGTAEQAAYLIAVVLNNDPLYDAVAVDNVLYIQPENQGAEIAVLGAGIV